MKVEDLREMPEEELIRHHDEMLQNRAEHYNIFLNELARHQGYGLSCAEAFGSSESCSCSKRSV